MSEIFTTIFVSDSRGKGIDDFVGNHPTPVNHQYVFVIRPGKSLAQLTPAIIDTINSHDINKLYCIVSAGICGLTDKTRVKGKLALRYKSIFRDEKVTTNIDVAKFLKSSYGDKINICSIIPADLVKYYQFHNRDSVIPEFLVQEQLALEEDVETINKVLLDLNSISVTNINLSSRLQTKSKKRRQRSGAKIVYRRVSKFVYTRLTDGVHYSPDLRNLLFGLIIDTAIRDITSTLAHSQPEEAHRQQPRPVGLRGLRVVIENDQTTDSDSD